MPALEESRLQELRDGLAGRVVVDGDPDWDAVGVAFNLLIDQRRAAVVLPPGWTTSRTSSGSPPRTA